MHENVIFSLIENSPSFFYYFMLLTRRKASIVNAIRAFS